MKHVAEALASWVSTWQVIVGLAGSITIVVVGILNMCVFPDYAQFRTRRSTTPEEEQAAVNVLGLFRIVEVPTYQLLVFGSLKSSPAAALAVCMVLPFLRIFFWLELHRVQLRAAKEGKRPSVAKVESLMPTSVYTDIHLGNMLQCLAIFGGQVMLYSFVLKGVLEREAYADGCIPTNSTAFFIAGATIAFMQEIVDIIQDHWREEWEDFWSPYFGKPGFRVPRHWPLSRVAMSFVINCYFQKSMILVLPLVLMDSSNAMEFVKDATSVLFISKIDDVIFSSSHHVPLDNHQDEIAEPNHAQIDDSDVTV